MADLKSYNDLKIPNGLFPPIETFFLERIGLVAIFHLRDFELPELNHYLNLMDDLFIPMPDLLDIPGVKEVWQIILDKISDGRSTSWDDIPKTEKKSELSIMTGIVGKVLGLGDGSPGDTIRHLAQIDEKFGGIESVISVISLKLYRHGVKVALEIEGGSVDLEIQYLRLGETAKFFYSAQALQNFAGSFLNEVNALKTANSVQKDKRIENARKGGMKSHSRKKEIQKRCGESYVIAKSESPSLKKAGFVNQFIGSLSEEERREFSSSNIQRNLADSIRRYVED
jgi:hypothetical protein